MRMLTSDRSNGKLPLVQVICKYYGFLCMTALSLAISGFLLLPSEHVADRTYFSDNALLPGMVRREFSDQIQIDQYLKQLQQEAKSKGEHLPIPLLIDLFSDMGLQVHVQNFTFTYPFGPRTQYEGHNVYAILKAHRTASTEAIVISSPYRSDLNAHGSSLPGIALMLSLAKYFSSRSYWAKDIIFLMFEHELIGCQAWMQAYHHNVHLKLDAHSNSIDNLFDTLQAGDLPKRSGQLQAAINLEIHAKLSSRLDLKIEGFNGQLPNLDLFNVAVELATRESATPTFHGNSHMFTGSHSDLWKEHAKTLVSMLLTQATSLPTGAHAVFQKYAVQSLTLQTLDPEDQSAYLTITLNQLGAVVEGIIRSVNNLLERFNRSYWFYLLASTRRYISIGIYMIPFSFLLITLLLRVIRLVYHESPSSSPSSSGESKSTHKQSITIWPAICYVFICHLLGISLASIPFLVQHWSVSQLANGDSLQTWTIQDVLFYTILCFCISCMSNPLFDMSILRLRQRSQSLALLLLNASLLFGALSLLNFSLATMLISIYIPFLLLISANKPETIWSKLFDYTIRLISVLIHPLSLMFICAAIVSWQHEPNDKWSFHLNRSFHGTKKILLYSIEDWYIHGNWSFFFAASFLFPLWLQFWNLV